MPRRGKQTDQLSLLDELFADDGPQVELQAWVFTCNQCLSGGHDCGMPFCRCQTCGGGFKRE